MILDLTTRGWIDFYIRHRELLLDWELENLLDWSKLYSKKLFLALLDEKLKRNEL